nr:anoctamin-5 [Caretta caretta]
MNRLGRKDNETLIEMALATDDNIAVLTKFKPSRSAGEDSNGPLCETISNTESELPSNSEGLSSTETTLLIPDHQVINKRHQSKDSIFFRDGVRRIDFVLSYGDDPNKEEEKKVYTDGEKFLSSHNEAFLFSRSMNCEQTDVWEQLKYFYTEEL